MTSISRTFLLFLPLTMLGGCGDASSTEDTSESPAAITQCEAGTYDDDGDSSTACVAWSDCKPGEFVAAAGTETTDRVCARCPAGKFSDAINAPACVALSDCKPGEFVAAAGTETTDRVCAPCPAGTFSDALNTPTCAVWSDCEAGQYVAQAGTSTADRRCEPCPAGTHSESPNSSQCVPQDKCPAGTVQTAPATGQSPPQCQPCPTGTYCADGDEPEVECGSGTWDDDANPASVCAPWTDCAEGEYVRAEGTAWTDRVCAACAPGEFSTTTNAADCTPWTECGAGEYVETEGTATSDRICSGRGGVRKPEHGHISHVRDPRKRRPGPVLGQQRLR